jgi:hypothetical protein
MPRKESVVQDIDPKDSIVVSYRSSLSPARAPAPAGKVAYDPVLFKGESMNAAVRLAALLLVPSFAAAAPPAPTEREPGVQWEQTVEMQMSGFSMPAQTSKVCVPKKGMTDPPGSGRKDDKCKVSDVRNVGNKMSWKMACEGEEKMSGEGEIVQKADGYDGKMTMRGAQGEMLMKLSGRKLGGECDAGEVKRQVAAIQAEGAAQMAKGCREMAAGMLVSAFTGPQAMCKDPADRAALCKQAATREGVSALSAQPAASTGGLASLCGKDLAAMKEEACADAGRHEAERRCTDGSDKLLAFIGGSCPAQTQVVAQRECAGRTYTDLTTCYRSFCTTYAANLLDKGKKPASQPQKADDAAIEAAKKAAKGFLPF